MNCVLIQQRGGRQLVFVAIAAFLCSARASAQTTPPTKEPPPLWDIQVGGSFVGTSGNSDTTSSGADFSAHRRDRIWKLDATATAVKTTDHQTTKAERYLGKIRADLTLTLRISFSTGETAEHDRFAGIEYRNILDAGLSWVLVKQPAWTLDGVTSLAWNHETRTVGDPLNDPTGVLQVLSKIPFGNGGDLTQRATFYPDFRTASAYRTEVELTAQAAMTGHLLLKISYLLRHSNEPVVGFEKTDHTTTASVTLRWEASTPARVP
jgi:putative salt-induced outer membrane protein YdiY